MIEIKNVSKNFDDFYALKNISANIEDGHVFGLIGTNGAGKSTLLRTMSGIYKPTNGGVYFDGENVYENDYIKSDLFYISDDQYFFSNSTPNDMMNYYNLYYRNFDIKRYYHFLDILKLDKHRKINTFSKGMKKQLSVILGVCANTKYLFCDETFDGLDPVMRQAIKGLFIQEIESRGLTPIIASHNLRELEDICEHVGLLHQGGILFSKDLEDMKLEIFKLQCVLTNPSDYIPLENKHTILIKEVRGSLLTLTIRGNKEEVEETMHTLKPVFFELIPLTLEEIFISETEVLGYDFKNLYS